MDSEKALFEMCVSPEEVKDRVIQKLTSKRAESTLSLQKENGREISNLNWRDIVNAKNIMYSAGTLALAGSVVAPIMYLANTGHETGAVIYGVIPGLSLTGCTFMSLWASIKQIHHSVTRPRHEREERSRSIQDHQQRISELEKELKILDGACTNPTKDGLYYLAEGVFIHNIPEDLRKYGRKVVPVNSEKEISDLEEKTLAFIHGASVIEAKSVSKKSWETTEGGPTGYSGINDEPYYTVTHEGFNITYLTLEKDGAIIPFAFHDKLVGDGLLGKNVRVLGNKNMKDYTSGERIPWLGTLYDGDGNTHLFDSAYWKESKFYLESSPNCLFTIEALP